MFKSFEILIALRYLFSGKKQGGVGLMSAISFVGITLAVFALIVTFSVRNGFKDEFLNVVLGANSHIEIYPANNNDGIIGSTAIIENLAKIDGVEKNFGVFRENIMITSDASSAGAQLTGILQQDIFEIPLLSNPKRSIGQLDLQGENIAIGYDLAKQLSVSVGDYITVISPKGMITPFGSVPITADFKISYIFEVGRYDVDGIRAFISKDAFARLFDRIHENSIEIFLKNPSRVEFSMEQVIAQLKEMPLQTSVSLLTWKDRSSAILKAIKLEDGAMFVILFILLLVSALNIISGLVMLVKNKSAEIGILLTMGYPERSITNIFFLTGMFISVTGTFLGIFLGVLFCINLEQILSVVSALQGYEDTQDMAGAFGELRAIVRMSDVYFVLLLSLILSAVVTYLPARKASKLTPIKALYSNE